MGWDDGSSPILAHQKEMPLTLLTSLILYTFSNRFRGKLPHLLVLTKNNITSMA